MMKFGVSRPLISFEWRRLYCLQVFRFAQSRYLEVSCVCADFHLLNFLVGC